jgi:hypothetical protein
MNAPSRWSTHSLLLCLVLLAPRTGLGARDVPEASAPERESLMSEVPTLVPGLPGTEEQVPRRLLLEPTSSTTGRAPLGVRLLAEAGAGLVMSVSSGFVALLGGLAWCEATGAFELEVRGLIVDCASLPLLGALVAVPVGMPLGVWLGGEAFGGDGKLLATLAGMGAGLLGGGALLLVSPDLVPLALALAVSGPFIGYELSQRPRLSSGPAPLPASSARPRLQPVLAFSSRGAVLGLGGTF